jgi:transketolase
MPEQEELPKLCNEIRQDILRMIHGAGSGHPGGSLSAVEIVAALYFTDAFQCCPQEPERQDRDRFILSKGHAAPMLYSVLAHRGYFPLEQLDSLRRFGGPLQGHPNMIKLPSLDCSAGSLGQGLSVANGLAYAFVRQHRQQRVFCLLGDGELQEGQVWEAALFAAQQRLDNICAIVDCNGIQLDGTLEEIKSMNPIDEKWRSFGWHVLSVDGHDVRALYDAYKAAAAHKGQPTVILAHTIKGKGISFMENQAKWHGTAPNDDEFEAAMAELTQGVQ